MATATTYKYVTNSYQSPFVPTLGAGTVLTYAVGTDVTSPSGPGIYGLAGVGSPGTVSLAQYGGHLRIVELTYDDATDVISYDGFAEKKEVRLSACHVSAELTSF